MDFFKRSKDKDKGKDEEGRKDKSRSPKRDRSVEKRTDRKIQGEEGENSKSSTADKVTNFMYLITALIIPASELTDIQETVP